MKTELIQSLTTNFEAHAQQTENDVEYWLARDLQYLLGYSKWDNFLNVVSKARTAFEVSGHDVMDHFADVGRMVDSSPTAIGRRAVATAVHIVNSAVEFTRSTPYTSPYIRPMAVRPLDHPERWPTPWGFLFSDSGFAMGQLQ